MALVRAIEAAVTYAMSRNSKPKAVLSPVEHGWLQDLYDSHNRFDSDGTRIWYVPRSWETTQRDIVNAQQDIAENVRRTIECLERIEARLNK